MGNLSAIEKEQSNPTAFLDHPLDRKSASSTKMVPPSYANIGSIYNNVSTIVNLASYGIKKYIDPIHL
jgi:hypothetical protein